MTKQIIFALPNLTLPNSLLCRDSIGDSCISGDLRWGGSYGVNIDFVARTHCSVAFIKIEDIQVSLKTKPMCKKQYIVRFFPVSKKYSEDKNIKFISCRFNQRDIE